ncbi:hypothetical protein CHS0354_001549 [Potamilus streckersoni]|uniref:Small RNA 2'-O-methyltransferase n=1 Tax=Potamilus streckersoni TaxID=2493646 RepID=A0AAE0SN51_9BIVA|nr:hypothetical protein CHS0354_001549 [Potamilus streckersoni]
MEEEKGSDLGHKCVVMDNEETPASSVWKTVVSPYSNSLSETLKDSRTQDLTSSELEDFTGNETLKLDQPTNEKSCSENEGQLGGPKFQPPLFIQRYYLVAEVMKNHNVESVIDFGCAECRLAPFLKQVPTIQQVALVDIDRISLEMSRFRIKPMVYEFLEKRLKPLTVEIFCGSATDLDSRLMDFEAVSMIELIEHLYPDTLEAVRENVFGRLQPRLVVITTPNADFNQLFPGFKGFRHADHKFEWTKEQFQSWCDNTADTWGYEVNYTGVGEAPEGFTHLGFCSQAAVFQRKVGHSCKGEKSIGSECYQKIEESNFPIQEASKLTDKEKLAIEVPYQLKQFEIDVCFHDDADENAVVPMETLHKMKQISNLCSIDELRLYLKETGYQLSEDNKFVIIPCEVEFNSRSYMYGDMDDDIETSCDTIISCDQSGDQDKRQATSPSTETDYWNS